VAKKEKSRSLDAELLHAGSEGGGMNIEAGCSAVLSFNNPDGLFRKRKDAGQTDISPTDPIIFCLHLMHDFDEPQCCINNMAKSR
jgi:hypothetical protein